MSKNTFASAIPPLTAFGEWRTAGEDIWVESAVAPWRGLFETLDDLGEVLPETPLTLAEEATAIFATCWRYGSYAHILTQGVPLPAPLRTEEQGIITNGEMRRIQIEFSAALAAWWELEDQDPHAAVRRARAAREFLPMPRCRMLPDEVVMDHFAGKVRELHANLVDEPDAEKYLKKAWPLRLEANAAVLLAYRDGPIESIHAGKALVEDLPEWPHVRRLYAPDLKRITAWSVHRLMTHLAARRFWMQEGYSLIVRHGLRECSEWSDTLETTPVYYRKPSILPALPSRT